MSFVVSGTRTSEARHVAEDSDPFHDLSLSRTYRLLVYMAALLLPIFPSAMVASQRNARKVKITEALWIGTTLLSPGDYEVKWDGIGSLVQVSFLQANKTMANASATAAATTSPHDHAAVGVRAISESSKALETITWKDVSLTFHIVHPF